MNVAAITIEHSIPIPPPIKRDPNICCFCCKRPRVEPYKTCDECRARSKRVAQERKAAGLCIVSPCPLLPSPEHVTCEEHLAAMREYAKTRREAQIKLKVCINCNKHPQWFSRMCVLCGADRRADGLLPLGAQKALKEYRRNEAIAERRSVAAKARELLAGMSRSVVELRHGLADGFDWSLEEIGQEFGVTRERIRQVEARAYEDISTSGLSVEVLSPPYQRNRRPVPAQVSEYSKAQSKAHRLVADALKAGTLTRQPCQECGDLDSIAHHHKGYDFPLEVEWVCRHHHMIAHGRGKSGQRTPNKTLRLGQPAAWLKALPASDSPRLLAVRERMKNFRPRLRQTAVVRDSGFKRQRLMIALRGERRDDAAINFLEVYITVLENEQRAKAA